MRYMVIVKGCEKEAPPSQQMIDEMIKYNAALAEAGVLVACEGLEPSTNGVRVRFDGRERAVTDGPFSETKELIGGFWLWECNSRQEAVEWLKRAPFDGGVEVEIRPVRQGFAEQIGARPRKS